MDAKQLFYVRRGYRDAVAPSLGMQPVPDEPTVFDEILSMHVAANVATARALAVEAQPEEPEEPEPLTGNPYIDRRNAQYAQWEE